jgi:hypothetical protein
MRPLLGVYLAVALALSLLVPDADAWGRGFLVGMMATSASVLLATALWLHAAKPTRGEP